jgi:hypothetical protein
MPKMPKVPKMPKIVECACSTINLILTKLLTKDYIDSFYYAGAWLE